MIELKYKRLTENAKEPTYGSSGAACFDLYADTVKEEAWGLFIGTGLAVEIPEGYVMKIYSRSGMGFKHGMVLRNSTGIIDSDYRGEIKVALTCHLDDLGWGDISHKTIDELSSIKKGDRIAQAIIEPVQQCRFTEVSELSETDRGEGGFGSSGK